MPKPPRPYLTSLPEELRTDIFSYLARADLLAIRLVSRACRNSAERYPFSSVITRTDKTEEQIQRCPTDFFLNSARQLRVSVVEWLDGQNGGGCPVSEHNDSGSRLFHDQFHRQQGERRYQNLETEHHAVLPWGVPNYLNLALSLPGLQSIVFANGRFNPHLSQQCGRPNCTYQLPPRRPYATQRLTSLHFSLLINALARRENRAKELIVMDDHFSRFVLGHSCFGVPPSLQAQIVFCNLNKLHLDLDTVDVTINNDRDPGNLLTGMNQTLKHATKLKSLSIRLAIRNVDWGDPQSFLAVLHTCVFPDLKTCILSGFKCDSAALLQFLAGSPELEELCIDWCALLDTLFDTWEILAQSLKANMSKLKDVQLRQLIGVLGVFNPNDVFEDTFRSSRNMYMNRYGLVQDFFFRDGVNPFGVVGRALERKKDAEQAREVVTAGWFERMKSIHGYDEYV
ncbi:MAG: hypothetical protein Q9168_004677 [Polycauliona sp. 1 TL-2023]